MGGEVIIITADPDARADPDENRSDRPKVQVSALQLFYSDQAAPSDVASAVHQALTLARDVAGG